MRQRGALWIRSWGCPILPQNVTATGKSVAENRAQRVIALCIETKRNQELTRWNS